jgi:hypothetical protein
LADRRGDVDQALALRGHSEVMQSLAHALEL